MTQTFILIAAIMVEILLFVSLGVVGYFLILGALTVPWVRTRSSIAREMLELAKYQSYERV